MSRRTERVNELLRETLAELLLREVKDPRIGTVTLTGVDVSPDLKKARVRFCTLGDPTASSRALAGLESAARFLQGKLARLLHMKYAPELEFLYDKGFDHAADMSKLLHETEAAARPPDEAGTEVPETDDASETDDELESDD